MAKVFVLGETAKQRVSQRRRHDPYVPDRRTGVPLAAEPEGPPEQCDPLTLTRLRVRCCCSALWALRIAAARFALAPKAQHFILYSQHLQLLSRGVVALERQQAVMEVVRKTAVDFLRSRS